MATKKDTKAPAKAATAKAEPAETGSADTSTAKPDAPAKVVSKADPQAEVVTVLAHHRDQILRLQDEERRLRKDPAQAAELQQVRKALADQQAGFRAALASVPDALPALKAALAKQAQQLSEMGGGVHWDDVTAKALQTAQEASA
jgi:DNA repair exonuclease SbcCD ATPase subunit